MAPLDRMYNLVKAVRGTQGSAKSVGPMTTAGSDGVVAFGGYVVDNEYSPNLNGKKRFKTYSNIIANTSVVASSLRYFLNILSKAQWSLEPATDSEGQELPGAKEYADFVESVMCDMTTPWSKVIRRAAMYRFLGFSVQEWTAKRRDEDGKIGILDVEARPQATIERWDLDESGTVLGCWQRVDMLANELYLPRKKIIHLVDDALTTGPEGVGLLRHAARAAERLRAFEELESIAFETDLRGIPIARAPLKSLREAERAGTITPAVTNKLLAPLEKFLANHIKNRSTGLMLDSQTYTTDDDKNAPSNVKEWDMELLKGDAGPHEAVAAAINRLTYELARVIGTEHLLLGSDGTGSLALSKSKTTDFYMTVASALSDVRDGYNQDYIGPVCDLNGIPKEMRPKFKTEDVQFKDVETMAAALQQMAAAGATLAIDDPAINEMRDLMGLSRVPQELMDRAVNDAAIQTAGQLDALHAKVTQAGGKPSPKPEVTAHNPDDVSSGETGKGKTTGKEGKK